jgi:dynactin complex subunit
MPCYVDTVTPGSSGTSYPRRRRSRSNEDDHVGIFRSTAGRARAEELRNKLNTVKIPKEHNGQVAACMRKFEETIDEHNSMVGKNLKIDERSKLEKLKELTSHIDEFDAIEDTLLLTDKADSMPVLRI